MPIRAAALRSGYLYGHTRYEAFTVDHHPKGLLSVFARMYLTTTDSEMKRSEIELSMSSALNFERDSR